MSMAEWYPGLKEDAHEEALARAWKAMEGRDLARLAQDAGAFYSSGIVSLRTFGRNCIVNPERKSVSIDGKELKPLAAMLILHYLANANPVQPNGKTISFRQLPGGGVFYPAFRSRILDTIGEMFHAQPQLLLSAMTSMEAKKLSLGEASVLIHVLPKLPVTVILWKGDDEVRGSANLLFDETASMFMSTEDLAAVGSFVVTQLIKAKTAMVRQVNDLNTL